LLSVLVLCHPAQAIHLSCLRKRDRTVLLYGKLRAASACRRTDPSGDRMANISPRRMVLKCVTLMCRPGNNEAHPTAER